MATNTAVRHMCPQPPHSRMLAVARLRYFARVLTSGPAYLKALIRSEGGASWRLLLPGDCATLQLALTPLLDELGDPTMFSERWEPFVVAVSFVWSKYLARYLSLADTLAKVLLEVSADAEERLCGVCGWAFGSFVVVQAHRL